MQASNRKQLIHTGLTRKAPCTARGKKDITLIIISDKHGVNFLALKNYCHKSKMHATDHCLSSSLPYQK